jgi:hypothetical protein
MKSSIAVVILTVLLAWGCGARDVRITEIRDQPTRYATESVSVTGVVTGTWGIPLVPFQLYNVDDGSGEITVMSRSTSAPSRGTRVTVTGKVNELGVFGGRSLGLHLQEEDLQVS